MKNRQMAVVAIVVVLILLIGGGLLYMKSAERQEEMEKEKQAMEQIRIPKQAERERQEAEARKVPEAPAVPVPEEVSPGERPEPIEPVIEAPLLPPISTADCRAESVAIAKKRRDAAPEGMVYVPGGVFVMGSPPNVGHDDESPAHNVCVSGFYIDKHEVTNAQFRQFVDATGYVTVLEKDPSSAAGRNWRRPYGSESSAEDTPDHPVVCVSWDDANAYARWAGKRLPTEAEWEKAARGTDGRIYPWGNELAAGAINMNIADKNSTLLWRKVAFDDGYREIAPVGNFPAGKGPYGTDDMAGNVWEWCLDRWDRDYYGNSPAQNPTGPETGEFRVIRGGSWFYTTDGARTAYRLDFRPQGASAAIGFRCVKDAG